MMQGLVDKALQFHTLSIADLIAIFEDDRPQAIPQRREALTILSAHPQRKNGYLVGITGTPGVGKSTLLGQLVLALSAAARLSVAVVAVDPSSTISGGALLGDRVRVHLPVDRPELYFRSQASQSELGGLAPKTFPVCRLLHHLFDIVLVETVGIGQSELDVRWLVDRLYLVLQPLAGDEVQLLKAGVLEVPDAIVVNKCDERQAARKLRSALASALPLAHGMGEAPPSVFLTSAISGEGVAELSADVLAQLAAHPFAAKERRYFEHWVKAEWGRAGERVLRATKNASTYVQDIGDLERAQETFSLAMRTA